MTRFPLSLFVTRRAEETAKPSQLNNPLSQSRWRLVLLALMAVSAIRLFHGLGEEDCHIDEDIYVSVTDHIVASGDWTYLEYEGTAYLNKPPLYFWLAAATLPLTDGGNWAYRFWSALFGIGCVLLTAMLGRRLFNPSVGVMGALILLSNGKFIYNHGARSATFDAVLTFLGLLTFLLWWDMHERGRRWLCWGLIGACTGAAFMLKTLGGAPLLAALGFHGLLFDRSEPIWKRIAGPVLALTVACLLAAPWHIAQWQAHGAAFTYHIFWQNYVERATIGLDPWHIHGPLYYFITITESCSAFAVALPALAWAAWRCVHGELRDVFRLLVVPTGLYLLVFSMSKSKLEWYVYPVFPMIALAVAWFLWEWVPRLMSAAEWQYQRAITNARRKLLPAWQRQKSRHPLD